MLGARAMPRCSCGGEHNDQAAKQHKSYQQCILVSRISRNRAEGLGRKSNKVILLKGKHGCSVREEEIPQRQMLTVRAGHEQMRHLTRPS